MADAQTWSVIALLAAALFAIVIEMRRMNDRMTDGFESLRRDFAEIKGQFGDLRGEFGALRGEFGELKGEFGELRGEFTALRADVRGDIAQLRTELNWHDHRPSG